MRNLAAAAVFAGLVVLTLLWLSCAGDPVETLVEASAPLCPKLANPCATMNCNPRTDARVFT